MGSEKMERKIKGFTLVELLVVISIIALLLAVLLPSLGKARETARKAVCLSNCKQWAAATATYVADNDGMFPSRFWPNSQSNELHHNNYTLYYVEGNNDLLGIFVEPYLRDHKMTSCPSRPDAVKEWDTQKANTKNGPYGSLVWGHYGIYIGYPEDCGNVLWGPEPSYVSQLRKTYFYPPLRASNAPSSMAVAGCTVIYNLFDAEQWRYQHPYAFDVKEEPSGAPNAFIDGSASWTNFEDMSIFQKYTRIDLREYYWPSPRQ
jgi:prepilin-type N-terminal cleavage/methylation domain-containing protein